MFGAVRVLKPLRAVRRAMLLALLRRGSRPSSRLALGATRAPTMRAALPLCDSATRDRPTFDPLGRPLHELKAAEAKEAEDEEAKQEGGRGVERGEAEVGIDAPNSTRSPRRPWGSFARSDRAGGFGGRGGFGGGGFGRGHGHESPPADADMMAFQAYVRQRLSEMDEEMFHSKRSTQALAELAAASLGLLLTYSLARALARLLTHSLTYYSRRSPSSLSSRSRSRRTRWTGSGENYGQLQPRTYPCPDPNA